MLRLAVAARVTAAEQTCGGTPSALSALTALEMFHPEPVSGGRVSSP